MCHLVVGRMQLGVADLLVFLEIVPFAQDALLLHGSEILSIVILMVILSRLSLDYGADEPSSELEIM